MSNLSASMRPTGHFREKWTSTVAGLNDRLWSEPALLRALASVTEAADKADVPPPQ